MSRHHRWLTEQQAVALSTGVRPLRSVSNTFIFSTRQQRAVSVASPTFSYTPLLWFYWSRMRRELGRDITVVLRSILVSIQLWIDTFCHHTPHCSPVRSHYTRHRLMPFPLDLHTDCSALVHRPYTWNMKEREKTRVKYVEADWMLNFDITMQAAKRMY